jgi:hypothetical protein
MCQKLQATTADILIAFQTRPGVDSDSIINAGEASVKGSTTKIKPQGKGFYGFKMQPGSTTVMQLFGTDYHVYYQDKDELETAAEDVLAITNWKVAGDKAKRQGTQRRLQMLGYYNGQVDKKMGKGSEYGILGFQADNKLRTDGDVGSKTRRKLDDVVEKKNKTGEVYISRRALIRFDWAPHRTRTDIYYGWPKRQAPMVDDRGFVKVKSHGIELYGPVICVQRKTSFRVKVIREFVDENATLIATSDDENLVEIKSTSPLPKGEKFILNMASKDPGRKPKSTSVKIKYKSGDTETEIASLQVIVMPFKVVKARLYWVTIKDSTGTSITCAGTPAGSTTKADKDKLAAYKRSFRTVKALCRSIWRHYGIYIKFLPDRSKTVTLSKAGRLSKPYKTEFNKMINAKDDSGNSSSKSEINVLVVHSIEAYLGLGYDAVDYKWPNGIVFLKGTDGVLETAKTMAHELGHFFSLANCIGTKKYIHADDDPNAKNKKTDLWTVSKLMYSYAKHKRPINPGLGYKRSGGKVTIRNLPSDPTDNEVYNANKWARNAKFYCKP